MIKLFTNHLNEMARQDTIVLESEESVVNIIKDKCKDFNWNDAPIWRQVEMPPSDIYLIDPKKWSRKSVATINLYNFVIDNEWPSCYPKREFSITASNSYHYLHVQRESNLPIFRMIPYDGANFGVAPRTDMFMCFKEARKFFHVNIYKVFLLLSRLYYYYSGAQLDDNTYEDLKQCLNELGGWLESSINEDTFDKYFGQTKIVDYFDEVMELTDAAKVYGSLSNFLIKILMPEPNGFRCMNYKQLIKHWEMPGDKSDKYNEIWTDSNVILIHERQCEKIKKMMNA